MANAKKKSSRQRRSAALPGDAPTIASELRGEGDHARPPEGIQLPDKEGVVDMTRPSRPSPLDNLRQPKMEIEGVRVEGHTWRIIQRLRSKHPGKSFGEVAGIALDEALAGHVEVGDTVRDAG